MSEDAPGKIRSVERGIFSLLVFAFDLLLVWQSLDYPYRARLAPLTIGIPTAALLLYQTLLDWFPRLAARAGGKNEGVVMGESTLTPSDSEEAAGLHRRELSIALWLCALLGGTTLFGILVMMPLFAFAYLRFWARESWTLSVIYAAFLWASIYALLVEVLQAQLPLPLLLEWLGS